MQENGNRKGSYPIVAPNSTAKFKHCNRSIGGGLRGRPLRQRRCKSRPSAKTQHNSAMVTGNATFLNRTCGGKPVDKDTIGKGIVNTVALLLHAD